MICSTLSGKLAIKHESLGVLIREDGSVLRGMWHGTKAFYSYTKGSKDEHGYMGVVVRKRKFKVHRLVAECFLENKDNLPTVDHINRDRTDNRLENLRWASFELQQLNCSNTINRHLPNAPRSCENKSAYNKAMNAHKLVIKTPSGQYTRTGFLSEDNYNKLKNLSQRDRYFAYAEIKEKKC